MTESDAIKTIQLDICNGCECIENCITNQCEYFLAIKALEKQEKIKDLLDSCTAYPDDMCDCLVEIEEILMSDEECDLYE